MADTIKISINGRQKYRNCGTLGMRYFLECLESSDLFDVSYHDVVFNVHRGYRGTIVFVGDKEIYLDFWEYPAPTFMPATVKRDFDLIVALQHRHMDIGYFEDYCQKKGVFQRLSREDKQDFLNKIVPWTFFPSRMMKPFVGCEYRLWGGEVKVDGFFCGKRWRGRKPYLALLERNGIEIIHSDQGEEDGNPINDEEYLERMMSSRVGFVLSGRTSGLTDKKNRREIDYMMMKKPLFLNYRPHYYDPLIEGKHYVYWDAGSNLKELIENNDLERLSENAYKWYLKNATPEGVASSFRTILTDNMSYR